MELLVRVVFVVVFVHPPSVDKDQDDKTENGTLLRHPETEWNTKKTEIIQRYHKKDGTTERNKGPHQQENSCQSANRVPVFLQLPIVISTHSESSSQNGLPDP
jgi:hypothetical protein